MPLNSLGPYRLERELGAGGMGRVYRAEVVGEASGLDVGTDPEDRPPDGPLRPGSIVAVKVVHPQLVDAPGFFERFLREAQIGRAVVHENVVRTFDAGSFDGSHFLVMEYVEGQTLRSLLEELGRVPEQLCRHVGREIAKGLAAIHAAGAVHRDLKPENVLVTRAYAVKVMDLGVARLVDEAVRLSQTGLFIGSIHYAAPEQFGLRRAAGATESIPRSSEGAKGDRTGAVVDHRADLHALGIVLYELATGAHPYGADDFRQAMRRVLDEAPRRPASINSQISPFFEELVLRLLAKRPDERFASADEVARTLDEGEESAWWKERARAIREITKRPLRRIRIPRETALYGREDQLASLAALFEKVKAGDGQVVLVEGEAGIGKSRLMSDFVDLLPQQGHEISFLVGGYPPGGAATAWGAFATAYREQFGEAGCAAYLPQTPMLVPAFDALLRGETTPTGGEPLTKDSIQSVFVHATRNLAAERPTIVLIDDLHFAPEEGRALFAALALAVPGHRVLLVGTTRPGLDERWLADVARMGGTRLSLARLGAKDVARLLIDALKSEKTAEDLALKVLMKSDGNPFFVFEILRGLREGRFLTRKDDGTWATTRVIAEIEIPSSVLELVQARVADLADEEKNLLDVASCLGFEFDPLVVADVLAMARIPAMQALARIEKRRRLVRSAGRRFVFDHHQVAEAIYGGLPEILREEYHAAVGAALERLNDAGAKAPQDLDGALCVDLAEHFLKGALGAKASRYLDPALRHLEKGYLNEAAVRLADRALDIPGLVAGGARGELLLRKAERLDLLGRREAQRAALDEACAIADAEGGAALRARARIALGWMLLQLSRHDEAEAVLREALELAAGNRKEEATVINNLGILCWSRGRIAQSREFFERRLTLSREIGDRNGEAGATVNLGSAAYKVGAFDEAHAFYERGLELAREAGNRWFESKAIGNLGGVSIDRGELADARRQLERHLALAREIGARESEANALLNLGTCSATMGDMNRARIELDRALSIGREIGDRNVEAGALGALGEVDEENYDKSMSRLTTALSLRREMRDRPGEATALRTRGAFLARHGRIEEARADLGSALAIARESSLAGVELLATAWHARLPGGDVAAAAAALAAHEARASFQHAMEARFLLWQATRDAAHIAQAKRRLDHLVAHAPPEYRASMLTNVRLHREIAAAAKEAGLRGGDGV